MSLSRTVATARPARQSGTSTSSAILEDYASNQSYP